MPDGICIYCGKIISDISKNICEECDNINIQKNIKKQSTSVLKSIIQSITTWVEIFYKSR